MNGNVASAALQTRNEGDGRAIHQALLPAGVDDRLREGFRMPARHERSPQYKGPLSESLRRRNPREGGDCLAGYGDLTPERV